MPAGWMVRHCVTAGNGAARSTCRRNQLPLRSAQAGGGGSSSPCLPWSLSGWRGWRHPKVRVAGREGGSPACRHLSGVGLAAEGRPRVTTSPCGQICPCAFQPTLRPGDAFTGGTARARTAADRSSVFSLPFLFCPLPTVSLYLFFLKIRL